MTVSVMSLKLPVINATKEESLVPRAWLWAGGKLKQVRAPVCRDLRQGTHACA